jgi:glutamate racemase
MIGVFDSGVGGLSVHRTLVQRLPQADFLYFADQAHTPYGTRSPEEIVALTRAGCAHLFNAGVDLVVLACNTAAAIALRPLQREWLPDYRRQLGREVNVIGLIVPTIEAATGMRWQDNTAVPQPSLPATLGIFATAATVRSQVYTEEMHKRRADITVIHEECTDLARLIEAGTPRHELREVVHKHAHSLCSQMQAENWRAILGCTHYEIVSDLFVEALPTSVKLIHQPAATADALVRYLDKHPEYAPGKRGIRQFMTTGNIAQSGLTEAFWGSKLVFQQINAA